MQAIHNETPDRIMFTLPVFYRVQANFHCSNEIRQYDYTSEETVKRMMSNNLVAGFKVRPRKSIQLDNDLYERASI